jgi:glucoamylase
MPTGKILRIVTATEAAVVWSSDAWATPYAMEMTRNAALNLWFSDLPTASLPDKSTVEFTIFWKTDRRWEGRNYLVTLSDPT